MHSLQNTPNQASGQQASPYSLPNTHIQARRPSLYSLPNISIQESNEQVSSGPSKKHAIRPERKERKHPPLSFTTSKFGKYYAKTPDFERTEGEARRSSCEGYASGWGYSYGTRFREKQLEQGEIVVALCPSEGKATINLLANPGTKPRSASVSESSGSELVPHVASPLYQQEMSHNRIDGLEKSPFGWFLYHETPPPGHYAKINASDAGRSFSWTHTEDEVSQLNDVLDLLLAL